jgi:hypothetical protein
MSFIYIKSKKQEELFIDRFKANQELIEPCNSCNMGITNLITLFIGHNTESL